MKIAANLLHRIKEDDVYTKENKVFLSKNRTYGGGGDDFCSRMGLEFTVTKQEIAKKQRKQELEYLFKFMSKHIDGWWD